MAATTPLGPRRWYHDLSGRDRDYRLFLIPDPVVDASGVIANTKRRVRIVLSTGRVAQGFCTITSGTELSVPSALQEGFRAAAWFVCEIIGDEVGEQATLDWSPPT